VHLSSHIPYHGYIFQKISQGNGSFDLNIVLQKENLKNGNMISSETLLCFEILERKYDEVEPHIIMGNYNAGSGHVSLYSILQHTYPSQISVSDQYDRERGNIQAGYLHLDNLKIVLENCAFDVLAHEAISYIDKSKNEICQLIERSLHVFYPNKRMYHAPPITPKSWDPLIPTLSKIHCPYYQQSRCLNVGCAYAMHIPSAYSTEEFYAQIIRITLDRYKVSEKWFCAVIDSQFLIEDEDKLLPGFILACILAAQGICVYSNSCYYSPDETEVYENTSKETKKKYEESDRFTILRVTNKDDCEGFGHEMTIEVMELVEGYRLGIWKSSLVKCFAKVLGCFVPEMVHGAVNSVSANESKSKESASESKLKISHSVPSTYSPLTDSATNLSSSPSFAPLSPTFARTKKEAPQWNTGKMSESEKKHSSDFYALSLPHKTSIDLISKFTSNSSPECHLYTILDPISTFVKCMNLTIDGQMAMGSCAINPNVIKKKVQPWVGQLPRLFLEGTGSVFPLLMPLGLVYPENGNERNSVAMWQTAVNHVRRRLEKKHRNLGNMVTTVMPTSSSCAARKVNNERTTKFTEQFYLCAVAAYVPNVCIPMVHGVIPTTTTPRVKNNTPLDYVIIDTDKHVFREICFIDTRMDKYGVIVPDLIYSKDKEIAYVPTLTWTENDSKLVSERLKYEIPVPPMDCPKYESMSKSDASYEKDVIYMTEYLKTKLEGGIVYSKSNTFTSFSCPSPMLRSRNEDLMGIPANSVFDYQDGNSVTIIYQIRAERLLCIVPGSSDFERGSICFNTLMDAVKDEKMKIFGVDTRMRRIGKSVTSTDMIYVIDVILSCDV